MVKQSLAFCIGLIAVNTAFADTLQSVLLQTLRTNPTLLAAQKDRSAVTQALRGAKAGYLPTLDATAGYGVQRTDNAFTATQFDTNGDNILMRREAGLAVNQMIFDGFAAYSEVKRNEARLSSADYKVLGTAQDIALNAVEAYLTVLKEQRLIDAAQRNLAEHQQIADLIQKRSRSGVDQTTDLTQAQGRLDLAKANLVAEQANLIDAESNYLQVVGETPSGLSFPSLPSSQLMPKSENQAVQMAVDNHPVLKSAKADMLAAYAQHEAAYSKNYPRFDLQLSVKRDNNIDGVEDRSNDEQAMVRMNYNLYNGGSDKAKQNETAYLYQESAEVMHKTYRQVVNNAQLSWNALVSADRQLPLLKAHRDKAAESFQSYEQQFQLGKRTLLDLLDAQNEYYTASIAYTNGRTNALFAEFRVLNSIGALIQAENIHFSTSSV